MSGKGSADAGSGRPSAVRPFPLLARTSTLPGIGPARARDLAEAGYPSVGSLLLHLPVRYEDRRRVAHAGEVERPGPITLRGRLVGVRAVRVRRRGFSLVRGRFEDDTGSLPVIWFNQPYLASRIDAEADYVLHGEARPRKKGAGLELVNPSCEPASRFESGPAVTPVYGSIGDLGPAFVRRLMASVLGAGNLERGIPERLPAGLLERYGLPRLGVALDSLHRPSPDADLDALERRDSPFHRRLIYGEFLELQLELALAREREIAQPKRHRYRVDDELRETVRGVLPFRLTGAQRRALGEIVEDMRRPAPMLRLLQGDVGSGKTIVAALAMVVALESGLQVAFMAPTELLAEQHFRSLRALLGKRYRMGLLTGSVARSSALRRDLARGAIQLVIGTHALIQESVSFEKLGLAVVDEQHRFGVVQRQRLGDKGDRPDILVMTATPIPRSLALTVYGDLELSVIDELPPGRHPIASEVVPISREGRRAVYGRLAKALDAGAQAYVVFPLIDESEEIDAASVEAVGERLRAALSRHESATLHGRLDPEERDRIMRAFAAGEIRLLVATTVIEVGVDVPAATWMVVESAERFGLAQLHQLRGRVGRGEGRSVCVALHGELTLEGERRLEVFARTSDGFEIAEADLEIRGPGDLLGTRQAGLPVFRVADLIRHRRWLERARRDARELLPALDRPEHGELKASVERRMEARRLRVGGG